MIPSGVQVFVAIEPVDMRYGSVGDGPRANGLRAARGGSLFVFVGRRRQTVKILFADSTGRCIFSKRLDRGTFSLPDAPAADATHIEVDESTLDALLDGLELAPGTAPAQKPARPRRPRPVH